MQIKIISCETLHDFLLREDCLLVDLRDREDYETEHLSGAMWADWETMEEKIEQILAECGREIAHIVLYCDRGNISLLTARDLARHGYPVISVGGGYMRCRSRFSEEDLERSVVHR